MENFIFCAVHTGPYSTSYYSKEAFLTKIKIPEISMQKKEKESIMVFSCKFAVYFQNTRTSFQNTSGRLLLNIHTGPCSTSYYLKEDFLIKIECPGTSKQKKESMIQPCFQYLHYLYQYRSSHPGVFLGKYVLKTCNKFRGEHPCQSLISNFNKVDSNFIEITLWHGCSPAYFPKTFS